MTGPPSEVPATRRSDWRDTLRVATDVALLGFLMTVAALPVVTAGAAVATGSAALHHFLEHDRWPSARASWSVFYRSLLPGLVAAVAVAVVVVLLVIDLTALRRGAVPGGAPLVAVTVALAAAAAGYAALVTVALGADSEQGWVAALRGGASLVAARPMDLVAAAGVVALTVLLAILVHPALTPILAGYALFALHAVVRRPRRTRDAGGR
jgi:hypothetical protein